MDYTQGSQARTIASKPSDTNAATIYAPGTGATGVLKYMNIAATSAASATVWWNDGSTDYLLLDAYSLPANTSVAFVFGEPVIRGDDSAVLKVKTSSANNITFTARIDEFSAA